MKFKDNNKIVYVFILIAMVIEVLAAVVCYMDYTQKQERLQMVYSLKTSAEKDKKLMEASLRSKFDKLQSCADDYRIYRFSTTRQWKNLYNMHRRVGKSDFFAVGVVTEDGKTYSNLDRNIYLSDYEFIKQAREKGSSAREIGLSGYSGESVFAAAIAPFDEKNSAVIFGLSNRENIMENIDSYADEMNGCFILCGGDGNIVMSSGEMPVSDRSREHDNFLNMLSHSTILGNDFERISHEIANGIAGAAYISDEMSGAYCSYYPFGVDSLTVVNIVPESRMIYNFRTSESDMWSLALIVAVFIGAAIICIIAVRMSDNQLAEKAVERMAKSESDAEKHREMLSFVLKNSSTQVWEYDVAKQHIIIQSGSGQEIIEEGPNYYIDRNFIHPDDIGRFLSIYSGINNGEPYVFGEIRAKNEDESVYRWMSMQGYVVFDDNNKPLRAMLISRDISVRREIEQRYKNEVQMRRINDPSLVFILRINLTTGLIEDRECNNELFADLLECTSLSDVNEYITNRIVGDSDRRRVRNELTLRHFIRTFGNGVSNFDTEYRCLIREDMVHWIRLSISIVHSPTTDDMIGFIYIRDINSSMIMDLTTRKTISDEYEYVAFLDMPSDMIYAVKVNSAVGSCCKIEEERYSQRLIRLSAGELPMTYEKMTEMSIEGISRHLQSADSYAEYFEVKLPDGTVRRKKVHYSYIEREKGMVLLNRSDVTDFYEEEQRKNARLTRALIEAEQAKKARGEFLAHMSHEIRTPLNGIRGMLDIIKADPGENLDLYLDKAIISSRHLTGLINDILDMSRIDSGKMELGCEWVELDEIKKYIDAIISPLAEERGHKFSLKFTSQECVGVYTDESRIKQIFINLLSNAVKYTPDGGRISCEVEVSRRDETGFAVMSAIVKDNGIGMSEKFIPHAFEPFAQAEKSFNRKGTGLGLVITKSIIDMMDGQIEIDSSPGVGTKISFYVRLKGDETAPVMENSRFSGIRAMVVDDHDINLIITEKLLTSFGVEVICVTNGAEAFEMFENSPEGYFDAVFMDMMMPVMDGMTAAGRIRALKRADAKAVKIIAMTANTFAEYETESGDIVITDSLPKPYSREQLSLLLQKYFGSAAKSSKTV